MPVGAVYAGQAVTPQYFGAPDVNGSWSNSIDQMITYIKGGAPNTVIADCNVTAHLPYGTYKITRDINISSVDGFTLTGDGSDNTTLVLSGPGFTNAGIFSDGAYRCRFKGITITGDGTESAGGNPIPYAFATAKSSSTAEITSNNTIEDISVQAFNWAVGILIGDLSGVGQNDDANVKKCIVQGLGSAGFNFTNKWLAGYQFGDGVSGNQYNHLVSDCSAAQCQNGVKAIDSYFTWRGGEFAANAVDFNISPTGPISIYDVQSQISGRFLASTLGGSALSGPFNLTGIEFIPGSSINADGKWIYIPQGAAVVKLDSCKCYAVTGAAPVIAVGSGAVAVAVTLINVAQNATLAAGVVTNGGGNGTQSVLNYVQLNASAQIAAITGSSFTTGL